MEQIMKSFRQTMLAICVILIASAFAGCGADTDLPDFLNTADLFPYIFPYVPPQNIKIEDTSQIVTYPRTADQILFVFCPV